MNKYDPHKHHRRSIRLKDYDYSTAGCYFVTICVQGGQCLLGDIVDGEMILTEYGRIAQESWLWLAERHNYISLDEHVIMPNHMHGIVVYLDDDDDTGLGASRSAPTHTQTDIASTIAARKPLGRLIGAFKTIFTKRINELRGTERTPFWQRNYWEHIIRNERALVAIREYIVYNPVRWEVDKLHPDAGPNPFNEKWERP